MFKPLKTASAVLLCTAISTAVSAAGQRSADAHVHGHGQLNFAVDGRDVHLELEIPAADVLGFESIKSDKQKAQLKETLEALESGSLWQFTEAAQCQMVSAEAFSGKEHKEEGHHDDHDDHHEKHDGDHDDHHEKHEAHHGDHHKEHHDDHDDHHEKHESAHDDHHEEHHGDHEKHEADHDEHHGEGESTHLDISATYHYRCEKPQAISSLKTTLFQRFKNSEELAVQGFTARGQVSLELNRKKNEVKF